MPRATRTTLVLGGTRSGKSAVAEGIAARAGRDGEPVTYVATARVDPTDAEMVRRVEVHQRRRPDTWRTIEAGADLVGALAGLDGVVLVDSLGTWVAAHADLAVDGAGLVRALTARPAPTVLVAEEVGGGVHPTTELGRRYRDVLGTLNQQVADVADEVLLVVAGRVVPLPPRGT